jgi:uncharacterized SAM-binding protein YcdF (DUF218 family)
MSTTGKALSKPPGKRKRRAWVLPVSGILLVLVAVAVGWYAWVFVQIQKFAEIDQAAPSDAIVVLGAAEYDGKPSPVFRARLDHAHTLYERAIAPLIITVGGTGGDEFTEGGVGREYLMGAGVPESAIIAETESKSTSESAQRVAVIARTNHLSRLVIVSDAVHMFRIHAICAADGLNVLTSPRPRISTEDETRGSARGSDPIFHEILTYTLWRLHLD